MSFYDNLKITLEHLGYYGDLTSLTILLGTFAELLPPLAALLSILWLSIRIYETDTIQQLLYGKRYYDDDDPK